MTNFKLFLSSLLIFAAGCTSDPVKVQKKYYGNVRNPLHTSAPLRASGNLGASNTVYDPDKSSDFSKRGFNFNGQGVMANIMPGSVQNIDLKLNDDHDFTGVQYLIWGGAKGDFVNLQIVDSDNSLANTQVPGYPPGVTYSMVPGYPFFGQYATTWYVNTDGAGTPINIPYPAKILAGMTIRIVYTSVGTVGGLPTTIAINFNVHKMKF